MKKGLAMSFKDFNAVVKKINQAFNQSISIKKLKK